MRSLRAVAVGALAGGVVLTGVGSPANADPGSAGGQFHAHASTADLTVRALTGPLGLSGVDVDVAVADSTADTEAEPGRQAVATAANLRASVGGADALEVDRVSQSAGPDNAEPATAGLSLSALSGVVRASVLNGSAQARWSEDAGPCAGTPISESVTSVADLSVSGTGPIGGTALVSLPGTVEATSRIALGEATGSGGRPVVATSTMSVADLTLLAGTPAELEVKVISAPTLTVTATGDSSTSTVEYTAPILKVRHGDHELGRIDADNPVLNVPVLPGLPGVGALRLSIGELAESHDGTEVAGQAGLLTVTALSVPGASLAEIVVGAQDAGASAPAGGVDCDRPGDGGNGGGPGDGDGNDGDNGSGGSDGDDTPGQSGSNPKLAETGFNPVPVIGIGGVLLLVGSVLLAAFPSVRRKVVRR